MTTQTYELRPVGTVYVDEEGATIELLPEWAPALAGLQGFSHVIVVWWCHYVDGDDYRTVTNAGKPYTNGPDNMGIFATRSPVRPNPIAFSPAMVVELDVDAGVIRVPFIDAEDGSPVLDIKPYSPCTDRVRDAASPAWCAHWPAYYEDNEDFDWEAEFNF